MAKDLYEKDSRLLERHFIDLSRLAFEREIVTYTDFLNLNEQNILHTTLKDKLYSRYLFFGGYGLAERQMAAFIPDALYLRWNKKEIFPEELDYPFCPVHLTPNSAKFSEDLTHRDYLGAILNLGIERDKIGDILTGEKEAYLFAHNDMVPLVQEELTRVRHTPVRCQKADYAEVIKYTPKFETVHGTVSSVRLDSLLALAFSSSRTKLSGLIEGGKVFVNGRMVTSNGYQLKEDDVISVRGYGKFRFAGTGKVTKKQRISVTVHRFA